MKILSCGDIHFTNYTLYNNPIPDKPESGTRLEDILTAFDMFAKYGYEHDIHTYMLNGDIFDSRQKDNPSTIAYIKERIYNAFNSQDVDTTVYINVGNHDECARDIKPNSVADFSLFSNEHHKFIVLDNNVNLVDFGDGTQALVVPYTEFIEEQKEAIHNVKLDKPTVVFAHLGVNGATQGRWNHRLEGAYNLDDLKYNDPNVKGIVLSHYHTRSCLYPNVQGKLSLPSDTPTKHNQISKHTLDLIEYGLNTKQITVDFQQGEVNGRPVYIYPKGYAITSIKDKTNKYHSVSVAIIIAFVKYGKNKLVGKQVDHINNKHGLNDNYPSNLQILSSRENLQKEMADNNRRIPCKAINYFTHTEVHAQSTYELALRTKTSVSSIVKCVHGDANVAGDFLVAKEFDDYRLDISYNHFSVQGKNISSGKLTPVFSSVSEAEEWLNISAGNSHIGGVCRGIYKQTKGYTWWYVPSHPEAYYIGDLTELNFNDIQEDGTGAPRGFEEIDTFTGEHKFIDLTKDPYNIPTFNQIDLDSNYKLDLSTLNLNNHYKIITKDKEAYERLFKERESLKNASNIQVVYVPKTIDFAEDTDTEVTASDKELVKNYCDKYYPDTTDLALQYLAKASEV